ncbi:MAG: nucleotidyltransferase domain-containing protein [Candidatus Muiribacteriota bacterium]
MISLEFGLNENVIKQICSVFESFPEIKKVIIYGSRAVGNFKDGSDIDLTLIGDNIEFEILTKLLNELDDLLLPYQFDVSVFKNLDNQNLISHIKKHGKIFFDITQIK